MIKLKKCLSLYPQESFKNVLLEEILADNIYNYLLKNEIQFTGVFNKDSLKVNLLSHDQDDQNITLNVNIFYQEVMTTCPCSGEEPELFNGYCEIILVIDKTDASTQIINQ